MTGVLSALVVALMCTASAVAATADQQRRVAVVSCPPGSLPGAFAVAWAPDGLNFAYLRSESGDPPYSLYTVRADGRSRRRVVPSVATAAPRWSPDGQELAFQLTSGAVYVVEADGSRMRRVVPGRPSEPGDERSSTLAGWSRDSKSLLVNSLIADRSSPFFPLESEILIVDVSGGALRKLGDGWLPNVSPNPSASAWSPDGKWLAILRRDTTFMLVVVREDGTEPRPLARATTLTPPIWSPDGSRIAYVDQGFLPNEPGALFAVDTRDGTERRILSDSVSGAVFWTRGGIVLTRHSTRGLPARVAIVNSQTGRASDLTAHASRASTMGLSKDERTVLYGLSTRLGVVHRLIGIDGRNDRPVFPCRGTSRSDRVIGSHLNDVIEVRGQGRDSVGCRGGIDLVLADRRDRVSGDCERVIRR